MLSSCLIFSFLILVDMIGALVWFVVLVAVLVVRSRLKLSEVLARNFPDIANVEDGRGFS